MAQRVPQQPDIKKLIFEKQADARAKGYIDEGRVTNLINYFHVPKGDSDIRLVYDATKCGLNDALWCPSFWMPTIDDVLDCATDTSWYGDVDVGEMFLNFPLDVQMRAYAGVDVSYGGDLRWERWTRCLMGLKPSPFICTRAFAWAMEIIKGNPNDPANPFFFDEVKLNLPGTVAYDPQLPRVYKWNSINDRLPCDARTFVDDIRTIGGNEWEARKATHQVETMMSHLGIQDAVRKKREESWHPGAWAGSIVLSVKDVGVFVTVS